MNLNEFKNNDLLLGLRRCRNTRYKLTLKVLSFKNIFFSTIHTFKWVKHTHICLIWDQTFAMFKHKFILSNCDLIYEA